MDYEKKYKEAVCNIQKLLEKGRKEGEVICAYEADFKSIFPELKENVESDGERIRKELIAAFQNGVTYNQISKARAKDYIAWLGKQSDKVSAIEGFSTEFEKQVSYLIASAINREHEYNEGFVKWTANALLNYTKHELEKQDEHAKFRDSIQVGDKVTRNEDGILVNLSQLNRVAKKDEKQGEQKPWSEEDEKGFNTAIQHIENYVNNTPSSQRPEIWADIKKLKSLKERIQPKQEWSEEDYIRFNSIISTIECSKEKCKNAPAFVEVYDLDLKWFKSLKDRYIWKPTDKQMRVLEWCKPLFAEPESKGILESLINDLKKLTE